MTINLYHTTATVIDLAAPNVYTSTAGTALKQDRLIFSYLFTTEDRLKDQNKKLFLFLDSNLREDKPDVVNDFVNDRAIKDLHVSLLKSALIMTESLENINTDFLSSVYQEKING